MRIFQQTKYLLQAETPWGESTPVEVMAPVDDVTLQVVEFGALTGFVVDWNGKRARDATVLLRARDSLTELAMRTLPGGEFRFDQLTPGRYQLRAVHSQGTAGQGLILQPGVRMSDLEMTLSKGTP